jgi:hypothetical protein
MRRTIHTSALQRHARAILREADAYREKIEERSHGLARRMQGLSAAIVSLPSAPDELQGHCEVAKAALAQSVCMLMRARIEGEDILRLDHQLFVAYIELLRAGKSSLPERGPCVALSQFALDHATLRNWIGESYRICEAASARIRETQAKVQTETAQ